jgi:hypothetical protein
MYYRNPIKIMCTTRLNDGIFNNPPGLLSARETGCFCFLFFVFLLLECKQQSPHPPNEHSSPCGAEDFFCLSFILGYFFGCICFCCLHIPSR